MILEVEPKMIPVSVKDSSGRVWTTDGFWWCWTNANSHTFKMQWVMLTEFLGPIESVES